jgi:hypothetical protein
LIVTGKKLRGIAPAHPMVFSLAPTATPSRLTALDNELARDLSLEKIG